jgi:hypothetical protein
MSEPEIDWTTADLPLERIERYFGLGVAKDGKAWTARVRRDAVRHALQEFARGYRDAAE